MALAASRSPSAAYPHVTAIDAILQSFAPSISEILLDMELNGLIERVGTNLFGLNKK